MSIFGFVVGMLGITAVISESITDKQETARKKEKASARGWDVYYDHKNRRRNMDDDRLVWYDTVIINGEKHEVLKDMITGEIIRDYTVQQKQDMQNESEFFAIKHGLTVYKINDIGISKHNVKDVLVKDIATKDIYVVKKIEVPIEGRIENLYMPVEVYVDFYTGRIVRLSDYEVIFWTYDKYFERRFYEGSITIKKIQEFMDNIKNPFNCKEGSDISHLVLDKLEKIQSKGILKLKKIGLTWDEQKEFFNDIGLRKED